MRLITSSLRNQLLAGFALVTLVFVIGAAISISSLASLTGTMSSGAVRQSLADQLSADTYNMQGSQLMNTLTNGARASRQADLQLFHTTLAALGHHLITPADRTAYTNIQRAFASWSVLDARALKLAAAHDQTQAAALVTGSGAANQATDALSKVATALATLVATEDRHDAASGQSSATLTSVLLIGIAIALAIGIALLLSRRIAGGVRQMLRASEGLADGDIDQEIDVRSRDEVGAMARSFTTMVDYLRATADAARELAEGNFVVEITPRSDRDVLSHAFIEMRDKVGAVVRSISTASQSLSDSSVQMASTTGEVGRAISEIAQSVGDVANGAEVQVRAVELTRELSEQVSIASRESAEQAKETVAVAVEARASAEAGERAVEQVDEAMRGVQKSSALVSAAIQELGEKSGRIGGIVDTITAIAEQTNLLALNAAIEAARAGDQGRGFAVVAEEVRKLAEESQRAAASIAGLVSEIRSETDRAVTVVEHGAEQTDQGAETVAAAREAFQHIRENVESMTSRVEEIAASSARIFRSSEQMKESVSSVADVAEQSSASTEQVAAATDQTSASTDQIASSAQNLSVTAAELRGLIAQFTLR
jgi:methyl-accepting chemotaxis protein